MSKRKHGVIDLVNTISFQIGERRSETNYKITKTTKLKSSKSEQVLAVTEPTWEENCDPSILVYTEYSLPQETQREITHHFLKNGY